MLLSLNTITDHHLLFSVTLVGSSYSLKQILSDLRLEFAFIDGAESACRGSSASDNNPAHYKVVSGGGSDVSSVRESLRCLEAVSKDD